MAELLTGPWNTVFERDIRSAKGETCLLVPFVSGRGARFFLETIRQPSGTRVVTRLNDEDFLTGVSDIHALIELVSEGVRIRTQNRRLHAKMYLFGDRSVVVTSGNLTWSGIHENAEIGVRLSDKEEIRSAKQHFERVWESLKEDITRPALEKVQAHIASLQLARQGRGDDPEGIEDRGGEGYTGAVGRLQRPARTPHRAGESAGQHFCKFLWRRNDPAPIDTLVPEFASEHGAVAFPLYPGRPHQIRLNDYIYHTALTYSERGRDWIVFGRARVAAPHRPALDEVPDDLKRVIPEIAQYPFCVWLCDCEFIGGTIGDGVSLQELFELLGDSTFVWSEMMASDGKPGRHTEAIRYYRSHIALTPAAADALNIAFDDRLARHGKVLIRSGDNIWWNRFIEAFDTTRRFHKQR